ncbi:MAG: FemAB family PEP-CTERM system-associated protein [Planctomycetaceae bacterium]|nr:FemAB family PEP-CTERM system-associated protein [Planctomycetaceae bacterium]
MSTPASSLSNRINDEIDYVVHDASSFENRRDKLKRWYEQEQLPSLSLHPDWSVIINESMGHEPYAIEATQNGNCIGLLNLVHMKSPLFGQHLVSLPYLNSGGAIARDAQTRACLIDQATQLADQLNVKHLQLRHEDEQPHATLNHSLTSKIHMRLRLPNTSDELWNQFKPKVRNQVRKATKLGVEINWGKTDLLDEFYDVFSRNMRDLGTPVFGRDLFSSILTRFEDETEICVGRLKGKTVSAALLLHGRSITEVPSASSLRPFNSTNCNMLMYWSLLKRAIDRQQEIFDFGRSSLDSPTYRFKKQWGAESSPAIWQFYIRQGDVNDLRIESGRFDLAVKTWSKLPLAVTKWLGPSIVKGIP